MINIRVGWPPPVYHSWNSQKYTGGDIRWGFFQILIHAPTVYPHPYIFLSFMINIRVGSPPPVYYSWNSQKYTGGGIRWGHFQNKILLKILKIYGWGDTVGLFQNFKISKKTENIRVGRWLWGIYGGGCGGVRWGRTVGPYVGAYEFWHLS
jgi:hypothetical protein